MKIFYPSENVLGTAIFATLLLMPLSALAQIPQDGTVPVSSGTFNLTSSGQYSNSAPFAQMNAALVINQSQALAPYTEEYLEISAPNSAPLLVDLSSDCTRAANRFLDCYFNYPLSTADMSNVGAVITGRYYAKKAGFEGYLKDVMYTSGQAGSVGSSASSGSGSSSSSLPVLTSIPPTNTISAITTYQIAIAPNPSTYSASAPTQTVNFTITPNAYVQSPPYANELIELNSDTGAVISVSPQTDCTRNNNVLTCSKSYTLPASDLSQPTRQLRVRYYADRLIQNTQSSWIGFSQAWQNVTLSNTGTGTGTGGTQTCTSESDPMMPTQSGNGTFTFTIPAGDVCPTDFWIDPPIAGGYEYSISGAKFESVTMPSLQTVNDTSGYLLEFPPKNFGPGVYLDASETHVFTYPVNDFSIKGINPSLALDPNDATAFAAGINLSTPIGPVEITQSAIVHNYPGLGAKPRGCNVWTEDALKTSIKAALSSRPATTYNLRTLLDFPIQQALLGDLAAVRAWRPDTREINVKIHASYSGNGVDPDPALFSASDNPAVDTLTSIFRSNTQFMTPNTWGGGKFLTDHWYRVYSKVNVMDYDNEWISPWEDDCLYQTVFVKVTPTGSVDIRTFDNLSGTSNPLTPVNLNGDVSDIEGHVANPNLPVSTPVRPRPRLSWKDRLLGRKAVDKKQKEQAKNSRDK